MTRRRLAANFFTSALVVIFLCLTACHGDRQEQVTLHLIGEGLPPFEVIDELSAEFTDQTGIEVEIHPFEFETALSKTILDFRSNTAQYDVVMGIYFNLGKYAEAGEILPLEPFLNDPELPRVDLANFFQPVMDVSCYYPDRSGRLYGLPATAQTMYLWYRQDLFDHPDERRAFEERYGYALPRPDAQNPITWDQYRDLAAFFTRKSGERLASETLATDFYGTTLQAKRHPASWYEFANYLYSFGGGIVDGSGEVIIDRPEALRALEFYLSLLPYSPPGAPQYTWDDALSLFQQGRLALVTMWFDSSPAIEDPAQSKVAGQVGYSTIPRHGASGRIACQYGGWAFYINADTPHPEESYRLIAWLNQPEVQKRWAALGGLPSTLTTFEDAEFMASPRRQAERASLENLTAWTRAPYSEEVVTKGMEAISRAASGQATAEESLRALAAEIRNIQLRAN